MAAFTDEQIEEILALIEHQRGHTKYIGARYVPIFGRKGETSIEWDNSAPYEPLTIVKYNGNSYTSRQYVPEGIQITNEDFWANTGNYNAQIEQYRLEVANLQDSVDGFQDGLTAIENVIPTNLFSDQNTVKDYVDSIANVLPRSDFSSMHTVKQYIDDNIHTYSYEKNNPVYYGADPNGIIDSTAAINDCIQANKGGIVIFSAGTYLVTGSINLPYHHGEKVSIVGNAAVLKATGTIQNLLLVGFDSTQPEANFAGYDKTYIDGLILDCSSANVTNGIQVERGFKDFDIRNCFIYGAINGIYIGRQISGLSATPNDVFVFNCLLYGTGSDYSGIGIVAYGTDNNILMCRIYGYKKGMHIYSSCVVAQTHVLLRFRNQDQQWNPYTPGSVDWKRIYDDTMFAEIEGRARIISCYCDSMHTFLLLNTTSKVLLTGSFYYNSRNAVENVDCSIIQIGVLAPRISLTNNIIDLCHGTGANVKGIEFLPEYKINTYDPATEINLADNLIYSNHVLPYHDILCCALPVNLGRTYNPTANTWYVFAVMPIGCGAGANNARTLDISGNRTLGSIHVYLNADGSALLSSATVPSGVYVDNYNTELTFGLCIVDTPTCKNTLVFCVKTTNDRETLGMFPSSANGAGINKLFSTGRGITSSIPTLQSLTNLTEPTYVLENRSS